MRNRATGAVLPASFRVREVSPAIGAERVQRAITEQAVELVLIDSPMAGKILTGSVREKAVRLVTMFVRGIERFTRALA